MFKLTSLNLNGIRSATSKGLEPWLARHRPDCICVQEVKAQADDIAGRFAQLGKLQGHFHFAQKKGYSGVAVYSRHQPSDVVVGFGAAEFDAEGRYVELRFHTPSRKLSVISCYFPSGSSGPDRQTGKYRFLDLFHPHLDRLRGTRELVLHAFDDQGSQSDGTAALRNWWTGVARENFKIRTDILVEQFNHFSPIKGMNVNGHLTLGENIGDLGGLSIGYEAYEMHLAKEENGKAQVLDGFTGNQRFFLAWAQLWRDYTAPETMRQNLLRDPHSPSEFRANTVRNLDPWYDAFDVKEGDKMYLPPEKRVKIW